MAKIHAHAVVIGASRGIGLEIARQLHAQKGAKEDGAIVATMRKPDPSVLPADVLVETLDVTDEQTITALADKLESINTIVINAAVGKPDPLLETDVGLLRWYLESNVVGVHAVVRSLVPALLRAKGSNKKLVYISSSDASMQKQIGGKIGIHGPYSVSKAAGNMLMIQYYNSLQEHKVAVALIHPGWVATDMGRGAGDGGMPVQKSVAGVIDVLDNQLTFEKSPMYVDWKGDAVPW